MGRFRVETPSSTLRAKSTSPKFDDSPSRQLILDLERALNQVQIHEAELQKLYTYDRRLFQEKLDLLDTKKAQEDVSALVAATSRHETVRKEAEAELQQHYREVEEQERLKKQDEERRVLEQRAREKAEAERKAVEEATRKARIEREEATARKRAEDKAKAEEAERRRRDDALAREKAEKERKRKEEREKAKALEQALEEKTARESAAQAAAKTKQPLQLQGQSAPILSSGQEAQHQRYLHIHQHLKQFRKEFWAQCKKDTNLKPKVGDMRRAIKTSIGQLTEARGANKQPARSSIPWRMILI